MTCKRPELKDYSGTTINRVMEWELTLDETILQAIGDEFRSLASDFKGYPLKVESIELTNDRDHEYTMLDGTCSVLLEQHDGRDRYYDECEFEINRGGMHESILVGEVEVIVTL